MNDLDRTRIPPPAAFDAHVEGASAAVALDDVLPRPIALLDSSEIIEMSIKPSLWFVPIVSARTILIAAGIGFVVVLAAWGTERFAATVAYAIAIAAAAAVVRVALASLQWASRVYILTNRRALRLSGVFSVEVRELPLARVAQAHVRLSPPQRVVRVGSIRMTPLDERLPRLTWDHVAHPAQVYEKLVRAIRRASSGGPRES